jgi:hypothetical protein
MTSGGDESSDLQAFKEELFGPLRPEHLSGGHSVYWAAVEKFTGGATARLSNFVSDSERHVYWLHAHNLGRLSCRGSSDDEDMQIEGRVWQLEALPSIGLNVSLVRDPSFPRRVSHWGREVSLRFPDGEVVTFDTAEGLPRHSQRVDEFIDKLLDVFVGRP